MPDQTLYLDHASTSPLRPTVKQCVTEALDIYGNPSSLHHLGMIAETRLSKARAQVLAALGARNGQLVFTSGGTEANNLAILGSAVQLKNRGRHMITTAVEHPAVLEPMRQLERQGWDVTYIAPDANGDIAVSDILQAVREDTVLVSVMHVNNETGAIMPVQKLAAQLKAYPKLRLHVDGTQALGKMPLYLGKWPIDLYTVSAHKIGALKGTGALYVREGLRLSPLVHGGGQEFGLRSGTENVVGAIAFGLAAQEVSEHLGDANLAVQHYEQFVAGLRAIPGWTVYQPKTASFYIVAASLAGLRGEVIVHALEAQGLYISAGSACSTAQGTKKRSHVLTAMGVEARQAEAFVRFSWQPETPWSQLAAALEIVREQTSWLKSMVGV
ncbi:cysteine desulfurase family protein [Alicyclobacillus fodiniaquatilis]|uniref:Cysteine desulfurase family protein n=1 Tax=Alicyclobacillus fodiniaquatilis TaxID=1661150 RepID=A0ABW4JLM5_9BACL